MQLVITNLINMKENIISNIIRNKEIIKMQKMQLIIKYVIKM